jgi:hypothetical protein
MVDPLAGEAASNYAAGKAEMPPTSHQAIDTFKSDIYSIRILVILIDQMARSDAYTNQCLSSLLCRHQLYTYSFIGSQKLQASRS